MLMCLSVFLEPKRIRRMIVTFRSTAIPTTNRPKLQSQTTPLHGKANYDSRGGGQATLSRLFIGVGDRTRNETTDRKPPDARAAKLLRPTGPRGGAATHRIATQISTPLETSRRPLYNFATSMPIIDLARMKAAGSNA